VREDVARAVWAFPPTLEVTRMVEIAENKLERSTLDVRVLFIGDPVAKVELVRGRLPLELDAVLYVDGPHVPWPREVWELRREPYELLLRDPPSSLVLWRRGADPATDLHWLDFGPNVASID
jgi:hypothetical protein